MAQWKEITSTEQWEQALEESQAHPVVILKHSTTCPVSANALKEYEEFIDKQANQPMDFLLVKVIESRPVSNQIAADLGVKHESPQVLCVKQKESYWNTSHYAITVEHLTAVLN